MRKLDYVDFQARTEAVAYFITFRCYGTWLHGETRGSVDRRNYNRYGTPDMPRNARILHDEFGSLQTAPVLLDRNQRDAVESAIRQASDRRRYLVDAVNVRTNHVHAVVTATCKPEYVMNTFKAYATRVLREKNLIGRDVKPWARHGSHPLSVD